MKLDTGGFSTFRAPLALRTLLTILALALSIGLTACGSSINTAEDNAAATSANSTTGDDSQEADADTGTQQTDAQETVDYAAQRQEEMQVCAKFIDAYDKRPGVTPITPGTAFDPQVEGSKYTKGSFDDAAFNGSYGSHWTSGSLQGDMISFKSGEGTYGIVVYAAGPTQDINGFYRDAITVLDPNVDQNSLSAAIMDASLHGGDGKVDGCDLPFQTYALGDDGSAAGVIVGSYDFSQTDTSAASPQKEDENADQTEGWALVALEDYGKQAYPYGFKLHTFLGVQVADHPTPDEWEFQITCDVTNEYGATAKDQVCNATVNLIDGAWQVTDFSVH